MPVAPLHDLTGTMRCRRCADWDRPRPGVGRQDLNRARKCYARAMALDAANEADTAGRRLGDLLARSGDTAEALTVYQHVRGPTRPQWRCLQILAVAHARRNG